MHELGIMTGVLEAVRKAAEDAGATRVTRIDLRVGEMTEAIRDALDFAFEALQEMPENELMAEAGLVITMVEPKSQCLECGNVYTHDRFHMTCPECGSGITELLEGRELEISSIEVDLPDDDEDEAAETAESDAADVADAEADAAEAAADDASDAEPASPEAPADEEREWRA